MKILFRYLGVIVFEEELKEEKVYSVGRGLNNDIKLSQDFVSRNHGKIYFKNGKWIYQDLRANHPHFHQTPFVIGEDIIELENDLDLLTEELLDIKKTKIYNFVDLQSMNKNSLNKFNNKLTKIALCAILALGCFGTYFYLKSSNKMDTNQLLTFVSKSFVEFELIKDKEIEAELMKYAKLKKSDFKERVGYCSGFIVGEGLVMTANHCLMGGSGIEPSKEFNLKTHDNKLHKVEKVLGFDIERDTLLLKVPTLKKYPSLQFAKEYKIGQKVFTIGNPLGQGLAVRDGILSSHTKDQNNPEIEFIRYSAPASPGNSGGPLVDEKGQIVALVFARANLSENYNLGTESKYLLKSLNQFKNEKPTKIEIDTSKHLFSRGVTQYMQHYGLIDSIAQANLFNYPEIQEEHKNIKLDVNLPANLNNFVDQIYAELISKLKKNSQLIREKLDKKDIRKTGWNNQVTPKYPNLTLIDNSIFASPSIHVIKDNKVFLQMLSPMKPNYYSPAKYADMYKKGIRPESILMNIFEGKEQNKDLPIRYSNQNMSFLNHTLYSMNQILHSVNLREQKNKLSQKLDLGEFNEIFVGDEGLLVSQYSVRYPFLRPKSFKSIRIKDLKPFKESQKNMMDNNGRPWRYESWNFFSQLRMNRYCLMSVNGEICNVTTGAIYKQKELNDLYVKSVKDTLTDFILPSDFSSASDWANFLQTEASIYEFSDLKLDDELNLESKLFGFKINTAEKHDIRFLPTLVSKDNKSQWVISGVQKFVPGTRSDPEKISEDKDAKRVYLGKICSEIVEFPQLKKEFGNTFLSQSFKNQKELKENLQNKSWTVKRLKKKYSRQPTAVEYKNYIKENIPKTKKIKRKALGMKWQGKELYSYSFCKEVNEYDDLNSEKKNYFVGDFTP